MGWNAVRMTASESGFGLAIKRFDCWLEHSCVTILGKLITLVPAHPGSPGKRAVKWYVCVCVDHTHVPLSPCIIELVLIKLWCK